jgi:hypothetical protein
MRVCDTQNPRVEKVGLAVNRAPRSPPSFTPRRLAAARAALVRAEIIPASSSATAAICCSRNLPVAPSIMGRSANRTSTPGLKQARQEGDRAGKPVNLSHDQRHLMHARRGQCVIQCGFPCSNPRVPILKYCILSRGSRPELISPGLLALEYSTSCDKGCWRSIYRPFGPFLLAGDCSPVVLGRWPPACPVVETPSALSVCPSSSPVAFQPCFCWNSFIAFFVSGPSTPSGCPALNPF